MENDRPAAMADCNELPLPSSQPRDQYHDQSLVHSPHQRCGYHALDHDKSEFRLVKFECPQSDSSGNTLPPQCTVQNFSMDSAPQYKAVSYVWGLRTRSNKIFVHGYRSIVVSDNLYDFVLEHQSYKQSPTPGPTTPWLWVDQICINQSNIQEKNHLVAQMGEIFSRALQVLVWLGDGTDGSEHALRVISRWSRLKMVLEADLYRRCVDMIAAKPYWSRLWVIQEYALANKAILLCGSQTFDAGQLTDILKNTSIFFPRYGRNIPAGREKFRDFLGGSKSVMVNRLRNLDEPPDEFTRELTWVRICDLVADAKCSDIRDRIFGILSLVHPHLRIEVDYQLSAWQIREQIKEIQFKAYRENPYLDEDDYEKFVDKLDVILELK